MDRKGMRKTDASDMISCDVTPYTGHSHSPPVSCGWPLPGELSWAHTQEQGHRPRQNSDSGRLSSCLCHSPVWGLGQVPSPLQASCFSMALSPDPRQGCGSHCNSSTTRAVTAREGRILCREGFWSRVQREGALDQSVRSVLVPQRMVRHSATLTCLSGLWTFKGDIQPGHDDCFCTSRGRGHAQEADTSSEWGERPS